VSTPGVWKKCIACGKPIGFFLEPYVARGHTVPAGAVAHWKPQDKVGIPGSVPCDLYNALTGEELRALHEGAELIEQPTEFTPILG
jgi:hypothetical protein